MRFRDNLLVLALAAGHIGLACQPQPAPGKRASGGGNARTQASELSVASGSDTGTGAGPSADSGIDPDTGTEQITTPASATGPLTLTWLGTAGLYVTDGKDAILIDPFVSHYGMVRVVARMALESDSARVTELVKRLDPPRGTPVLVSHSHFDHALDAPYVAQAIGGKLVGSGDTAYIGIGAGLPEDAMLRVTPGKTNAFGNFKVTFRESCHGPAFAGIEMYAGSIEAPLGLPASAPAYRTGRVYSILIEHPRGRILHHASPCWLPDTMQGVKADLVLLGIYARSTTDEVTRAVVDAAGAKVVVPIHWDDFFTSVDEPTSPMMGAGLDEFRETLARDRPDLTVEMLGVGKAWTLP